MNKFELARYKTARTYTAVPFNLSTSDGTAARYYSTQAGIHYNRRYPFVRLYGSKRLRRESHRETPEIGRDPILKRELSGVVLPAAWTPRFLADFSLFLTMDVEPYE